MIANLVDISQFSLDDADSSRIVYGKAMGGCLAMDVNPHDGHVYWADYVKKTISRVHLNDTKNVAVIVNGKLTRAEGIAVDWIGNNIYWTNAGGGTFQCILLFASFVFAISTNLSFYDTYHSLLATVTLIFAIYETEVIPEKVLPVL